MSLTIHLPHFEGPLALLLYLIRKEEMDIMNIEIHKITQQYLEFVKVMKELDLEKAGDFIAMAATLIQIKSKMLLPQYGENGEVIESEDPRKELVQRLLEYQKYQEAGKSLYERSLLGRDVWARGSRERIDVESDEILLEENALFSLISAYRSAVRSVKRKIHQVTAKLQSIASRINEMRNFLTMGRRTAMSEMINVSENRRSQVLMTFLSLLELGKMGFVSLFQTDTYQEIYVEARKEITSESLTRVEEYENVNSESAAAQLIANSKITVDMDYDEDSSAEPAPIDSLSNDPAQGEFNIMEPVVQAETDQELDQELSQAEKELGLDPEPQAEGENNERV